MIEDKDFIELLVQYFTLRDSDGMNDLYRAMEIERKIRIAIKIK